MTTVSEGLPPARKAELRAAAIKVAVAALVAAGLFTLYAREVRVEAQVKALLDGQRIAGGRAGGARAELNRDTPKGWLSAEEALSRALALQPSNPWAVAAYADVEVLLAGQGLEDRAARADEALARAEARSAPFAERFDAHALHLIQDGHAAEAEPYLMAVSEKYGRSSPILTDGLGRAQRASGKLPEARASFKKAQDADWRSPRFVADYAQALLEEGAATEALTACERALQANSDHVRAQITKARTLVALFRDGRASGDLKLARSLADSAVERDLPPVMKAQALASRAEVRLAEGDKAGAAQDADAAANAGPQVAAALRAQALVAAAEKKPEAAALFTAALAADPWDASTYFNGAAALAEAGDDAAGEKLLFAYAATLPRTARYHLALARIVSRKGDAKSAQGELAKAQQLEPTNALVYFEEGRLAQMQKDTKAAVAAYERAAQLRDDFPEVYRQMGELYLENKDVQAALRVFNEALARYKAARAPAPEMEAFYAQVEQGVSRAGQKKLAAQWVKEARATH